MYLVLRSRDPSPSSLRKPGASLDDGSEEMGARTVQPISLHQEHQLQQQDHDRNHSHQADDEEGDAFSF